MPEYAGFLLKDFSLKREGLESAILFGFAIARQDIAGIYTRMRYSLVRNVRLNVWGQYFMGGNTPPPAYNPLFPHTG